MSTRMKLPAPHIRKEQNVALIYPLVLVALTPCALTSIYYYGIRAIVLLILGSTGFAISDYIFAKYVAKKKDAYDPSSFVSGAILVLLLPDSVSLWVLLAGIIFGSVFVKQFFGGLGTNIFNPALSARVFLYFTFPIQANTYTKPGEHFFSVQSLFTGPSTTNIDGILANHVSFLEILSGRYAGAIGTTCALAAIVGGVYLLRKGILRIHALLAYLLVSFFGFLLFCSPTYSISDSVHFLLYGGVMFIAIFSLGDYSSTPITKSGRIIFGGLAAILSLLMRRYGNTDLSLWIPILVMNALTPILDMYIRPRVFALDRNGREAPFQVLYHAEEAEK